MYTCIHPVRLVYVSGLRLHSFTYEGIWESLRLEKFSNSLFVKNRAHVLSIKIDLFIKLIHYQKHINFHIFNYLKDTRLEML